MPSWMHDNYVGISSFPHDVDRAHHPHWGGLHPASPIDIDACAEQLGYAAPYTAPTGVARTTSAPCAQFRPASPDRRDAVPTGPDRPDRLVSHIARAKKKLNTKLARSASQLRTRPTSGILLPRSARSPDTRNTWHQRPHGRTATNLRLWRLVRLSPERSERSDGPTGTMPHNIRNPFKNDPQVSTRHR